MADRPVQAWHGVTLTATCYSRPEIGAPTARDLLEQLRKWARVEAARYLDKYSDAKTREERSLGRACTANELREALEIEWQDYLYADALQQLLQNLHITDGGEPLPFPPRVEQPAQDMV